MNVWRNKSDLTANKQFQRLGGPLEYCMFVVKVISEWNCDGHPMNSCPAEYTRSLSTTLWLKCPSMAGDGIEYISKIYVCSLHVSRGSSLGLGFGFFIFFFFSRIWSTASRARAAHCGNTRIMNQEGNNKSSEVVWSPSVFSIISTDYGILQFPRREPWSFVRKFTHILFSWEKSRQLTNRGVFAKARTLFTPSFSNTSTT